MPRPCISPILPSKLPRPRPQCPRKPLDCIPLLRPRMFTTSPRCRADDHYETLGLPHTANASEIKKYVATNPSPSSFSFLWSSFLLDPPSNLSCRKFYSLSKAHHPDLHPKDPTSPQKFAAISNAYSILSNPQKRAQYDKDHIHIRPDHSSSQQHAGSYAGSRPASGLSKRRSTFRGPPPSFYRSGGWGRHSEKRKAHADQAASAGAESAAGPRGPSAGPSSTGGSDVGGGFGPSSHPASGLDYDVPHFDRDGHFRTHEQQEERRRGKIRRGYENDGVDFAATGVWMNFFLVSGVVGLAVGLTSWIYSSGGSSERKLKNV